jgi:hypothetical protein
VPRESLYAPEDLPKQAPRQAAFGQLQHLAPGMSDEAPAGLGMAYLTPRLIEGRESKGRVGSDDDRLSPGLRRVNDGEQDLLPAISAVDVSPFPDSEGGQCSYGNKWLRAPEITENELSPAHRARER